MGGVYRPRDTRPKRDVALEVLPQTFAGDAERVRRLQREAELLATLNHQHIAALQAASMEIEAVASGQRSA